MRYIHSEETLEVPENGTLPIAAAFAFPSPTGRPTTRPLRATTATILAMRTIRTEIRPQKNELEDLLPNRDEMLQRLGGHLR